MTFDDLVQGFPEVFFFFLVLRVCFPPGARPRVMGYQKGSRVAWDREEPGSLTFLLVLFCY